jgi:hypothetical protein
MLIKYNSFIISEQDTKFEYNAKALEYMVKVGNLTWRQMSWDCYQPPYFFSAFADYILISF